MFDIIRFRCQTSRNIRGLVADHNGAALFISCLGDNLNVNLFSLTKIRVGNIYGRNEIPHIYTVRLQIVQEVQVPT